MSENDDLKVLVESRFPPPPWIMSFVTSYDLKRKRWGSVRDQAGGGRGDGTHSTSSLYTHTPHTVFPFFHSTWIRRLRRNVQAQVARFCRVFPRLSEKSSLLWVVNFSECKRCFRPNSIFYSTSIQRSVLATLLLSFNDLLIMKVFSWWFYDSKNIITAILFWIVLDKFTAREIMLKPDIILFFAGHLRYLQTFPVSPIML